ncbi:hypothetical protein CFR78_12235 [Komagataeibacter rhaeticus]|uniref:hypothetical protein n=1 Tax=Komagataeibacter rhaeticus TaxID=215221 RepID=UPI0004D990DA|nr:hypothetical protein [Komagataeibacter rhaeticus]KDU96967.1 hypothetical protein GLUCORHAEAF1_18570 [Komagataeibacter rhaeticus AF1]MBL7238807.1 hypothetical protein [Komagataeibacter rhaeticus]PYD52945.1 hypothetical protein CFR78_12235 [Komagataeibacter rhaeticus]GBQ11714.1 hypothetical protein AA16663_0959 [Komagataeibacter rhaeticus DSM 16663]
MSRIVTGKPDEDDNAARSVYVRHADQKTRAVNAIAKLSARALDAKQQARGVTSVLEKGEKSD